MSNSAAATVEPVVADDPQATEPQLESARSRSASRATTSSSGMTMITRSPTSWTMLLELFGHPPEKGYQLAQEVDNSGRAILLTTTKEHAELKRDQIHAYGKDQTDQGLPGLDVVFNRADRGRLSRNADVLGARSSRAAATDRGDAAEPTTRRNLAHRDAGLQGQSIRDGICPRSLAGHRLSRCGRRRAGRCVRGEYLHRHGRGGRQEPALDPPARAVAILERRIVVMGCYATRAPEEVASLAGVAEVVTDKRELPDLLGRFGVVDVPTGISGLANRQRAYVKVQDGCLLRCSFCIIPKVRPVLASRPVEHILDEIRRLQASGYREMILTGIHLGHYGVDFNRGGPKHDWTRLVASRRTNCRTRGRFPHPAFEHRGHGSDARADRHAGGSPGQGLPSLAHFAAERFGPHPVAACGGAGEASDFSIAAVWCARRWTSRRLTTDVIVGFPGETEADFQQTCRVCEEAGFSKIHIFPFSARRTTPAASKCRTRSTRWSKPIGQRGWPNWKASCASVIGVG